MKYKILIATVAVVLSLIVIGGGEKAFGHRNGAPAGTTGSPGDGGNTCAVSGCHTGTAVTTQTGWITSNIPAGGYIPGTTYTITATATYTGRSRFGFEISPQGPTGNYMGTMTVTNSTTTFITGTKYITQKTAGSTGTNGVIWSFNWTAPASGSGTVTFYGAFNCANDNNSESGDFIYTSNLVVAEAPTSGLDCGIYAIESPASFACDSTITPIVRLTNFGTTTLDSANISYTIDAGTPINYTWIGTLASQTSTSVTLPSAIVSTIGTHTITATTSSPNGSTDVLTPNDSKMATFNLVLAGSTLPFSEGFEATTFPPTGWIRNNPDASTTWARNTAAHKTGIASAYMNNYNYSATGQIDELITPAIDLTTDAAPNLTFQVAYRLYTNPASSNPGSDTLAAYISTDCGITWQLIYKKFGVALTTITPTYSTSSFTPTASQWRQESVSLLPYATCHTAYLKFVAINDYENQLYLDDIYINGPAGVNDASSFVSAIDLFPNPSNDLININYTLKENANVGIQIFNMEGQLMNSSVSPIEKQSGNYAEMFDVKNYPSGIYFMHLTAGTAVVTRKFTVIH